MHQHRTRTTVLSVAMAGLCSIATVVASAQTASDNTRVNARDRDKASVTADQQKENTTDRDLTQKIRRAIMQDKALSSYAHNVKIISQDGQVTLKGPVRSEDEKQNVEHMATEVAGAGHVVNQMSVAPRK